VIDRYSKYQIDIASEYVAKKLTEKFQSEQSHHLELLRGLQHRDGVPLLFGHLYKSFAHLVIPRGGDFRTRNLSTGDSAILHLEAKTSKSLGNVHDLLKVGKNEYAMGPIHSLELMLLCVIPLSSST